MIKDVFGVVSSLRILQMKATQEGLFTNVLALNSQCEASQVKGFFGFCLVALLHESKEQFNLAIRCLEKRTLWLEFALKRFRGKTAFHQWPSAATNSRFIRI